MDAKDSEAGKELIPALNTVGNDDGLTIVESKLGMESVLKPVMASLGEPDTASLAEPAIAPSVEPVMVPPIDRATVTDTSSITDQNGGTNADQATDSASVVKKEQESGQIITPDESDDNMCKPNECEANVMDANKVVVVEIGKDDYDDNDDDGGKGLDDF